MAFDRFLLEHNVPQLIGTLFWLWVAAALGIFWLLYRAGAAALPDPWAALGALARGVLAILLFFIMFPFAGMLGGGEVMVRRNDWPSHDS